MSQFKALCDQALDILRMMQNGNSAIKFSSLTYADGKTLATTRKGDANDSFISCVESAAFYISSNLANHLTQGEVKSILISGKKGNILIQGVGDSTVLTTVTKKNVDIKKIMSEIEKYLKELRKIGNAYEAKLKKYCSSQESIISNSISGELSVQA
ncbi:MAG: roadblock/LC7 domain-containing protein [Candidatus Jordarchaeaceae archaeon]